MSTSPLNIIIFSKDRALQLHSLLESLRTNIGGAALQPIVLYRASTPEFTRGYDTLRGRSILPSIRWISEADFRADTITLLKALPAKAPLMFLVDDDVVFRFVNLAPLLHSFSSRHLFISIRADRGYTDQRLPRFTQHDALLEWRWHDLKKPTIWQYPFSVDGNIFHAGDICDLVERIPFRAPNSFEGTMHTRRHELRFWLRRPRALAPLSAALFNNPLNKVQTEGATWNTGTDPAELNRLYLDNTIIDNTVYAEATPTNMHHAVELRFKPFN